MRYLVFDVGGSSIKYSIMNEDAEFISKGNVKTPLDSFESFRETIGQVYDQYKEEIDGIAMSLPGILDSDRGYMFTGGMLEYNENREIIKELQERCPCKITIENDGKSAALAEVWKGSLKECNDGIVIVLGSGVGGGIIKDKKIHRGKNFMAGEFSFMQTNISIPTKFEGMWGYVSGNGSLLKNVADVKGINKDELDGIKVFEFINNGDKDVIDVLDAFTKNIATQIYNLQCIYDPERIAIGGGISAQDILIKYIRKNVEEFYKNIPIKLPLPEVVRCTFGNESNQIGALYNYLNKEVLVTN